MRRGTLAGGWLFFFIFELSTNAADYSALARTLDSLARAPELRGAQVGIKIFCLDDSADVYEKNADQRMVPASNQKLVTSSCALVSLGRDFRFQTRFLSTGEIREGTLKGDLIIEGRGDPSISDRDHSSNLEIFELWCDSLKSRGIRAIEGNLVLDERYFDDQRVPAGWTWRDLSYWYATSTGALSYSDNCVALFFSPGPKVGAPAKIKIDPQTDYLTVINQTKTGPRRTRRSIDYTRKPGTNVVTFFGQMGTRDTAEYKDYVSVEEPGKYLATVFRQVLSSRRISVRGTIASAADDSAAVARAIPLFVWNSAPLAEILKVVNKNSQNFYAEQILKTVGREKRGEGSFAAGLAAESTFLLAVGIDSTQFDLSDGSGLSSDNLVTADALVRLLVFMAHHPNRNEFYESMAIPGIDKTVKLRLNDVPQADQMRVKTGFIRHVSALSGYLAALNGKGYAFSLLVNNYRGDLRRIWAWQDRFCRAVIEGAP